MGFKKKTFWLKNIDECDPHLRFIISDPDENNMVMVVNMTTYRNTVREDNSCILNKGEHSQIVHKSFIKYSKSEELNSLKLMQDKLCRNINFKEDISNTLLIKIQNGAKRSIYLPGKFKKYFNFF